MNFSRWWKLRQQSTGWPWGPIVTVLVVVAVGLVLWAASHVDGRAL